ncbi:hypothetical protein JHN63_51340 [Streptomyces sp. MBT65]|uniref:hypothetical protein n=1 Tax=Streptomyces sp. MBT65 TaxID=1488395 RepID=UPI00190B5893|nr:hypothetical protein [Streptomyces sp. MBT65]MBK3581997.1 hypothetical protein [Streptomyces sp. MBT65]
MGRVLRGGRRALADYVVRRLWLSLVAFGASYEPFAQQAETAAGPEEGPGSAQRPGGPYAGHRAPDSG